MRILHVTKGGGGLDTYIKQLVTHSKLGASCHVVASDPVNSRLSQASTKVGFEHHSIEIAREIRPKAELHSLVTLAKLIKQIAPDVIHAHSSKAGFLVRTLKFFGLTDVPVIYTPHAVAYSNGSVFMRAVAYVVEFLLGLQCEYVLCNSPSELSYIKKTLPTIRHKCGYVYNSVSNPFIEKASALSYPPKTTNGPRLILMVGRLTEQKDPTMFVHVCHLLAQEFDDVMFKIVGAGVDEHLGKKVRNYIARKNLTNRIEIVPWLPADELAELMATAWVLCVPSLFESFGYVAAEASCLGVPVVATDINGLRDVVAHEDTGFLVMRRDYRSMARDVAKLLQDSELRDTLGRNGKRRAAALFDANKNAVKVDSIYRKLTSEF